MKRLQGFVEYRFAHADKVTVEEILLGLMAFFTFLFLMLSPVLTF